MRRIAVILAAFCLLSVPAFGQDTHTPTQTHTPTDTPTSTPTSTPTHTPTNTPTNTPWPRFCSGSCTSGACGTPIPGTAGVDGFDPKQIHFTVSGAGAAMQYGCKQCDECETVWFPATPEAGHQNYRTEMWCKELSCRIGACSSGTCSGEGFLRLPYMPEP